MRLWREWQWRPLHLYCPFANQQVSCCPSAHAHLPNWEPESILLLKKEQRVLHQGTTLCWEAFSFFGVPLPPTVCGMARQKESPRSRPVVILMRDWTKHVSKVTVPMTFTKTCAVSRKKRSLEYICWFISERLVDAVDRKPQREDFKKRDQQEQIDRSTHIDTPRGGVVHSVVRSFESVLLSNKKEDDGHPVTPWQQHPNTKQMLDTKSKQYFL